VPTHDPHRSDGFSAKIPLEILPEMFLPSGRINSLRDRLAALDANAEGLDPKAARSMWQNLVKTPKTKSPERTRKVRTSSEGLTRLDERSRWCCRRPASRP
jgi:hypothetical protein